MIFYYNCTIVNILQFRHNTYASNTPTWTTRYTLQRCISHHILVVYECVCVCVCVCACVRECLSMYVCVLVCV